MRSTTPQLMRRQGRYRERWPQLRTTRFPLRKMNGILQEKKILKDRTAAILEEAVEEEAPAFEEELEEMEISIPEEEPAVTESVPEITLEEEPVAESAEALPAEERKGEEGAIPENLRDEIRSVLKYMDQLLESLPEDKIQEFAKSEHFEVYRRLFEELELE